MKTLQQKGPKTIAGKKGNMKNGSDFSTPRGSEERHTAQTGRGRGRNRDYDLEHVSNTISAICLFKLHFFISHYDYCLSSWVVGASLGIHLDSY